MRFRSSKYKPSEMNKYFSNLAANLTTKENVESSHETLTSNLPTEDYCHSFSVRHTNYTDVCEIIVSLKNDSSSGHDDILLRYIKPVPEFITSPLVHIINKSINKKRIDPKSRPTNQRKGLPTNFSTTYPLKDR